MKNDMIKGVLQICIIVDFPFIYHYLLKIKFEEAMCKIKIQGKSGIS